MCQKWYINELLLANRFTMPYLVERVHVFQWVTEYTNVPLMADKYMPLMTEYCVCHYWNKMCHPKMAHKHTCQHVNITTNTRPVCVTDTDEMSQHVLFPFLTNAWVQTYSDNRSHLLMGTPPFPLVSACSPCALVLDKRIADGLPWRPSKHGQTYTDCTWIKAISSIE